MDKQRLRNLNRIMVYVLTLLGLLASSAAGAQSTDSDTENQQAAADNVLRLEQTIRANQEQPQVLTIVPWQLPKHQRLNEADTWQPVVNELPMIERGQFLRDLSIVNEVMAETKAPEEVNN